MSWRDHDLTEIASSDEMEIAANVRNVEEYDDDLTDAEYEAYKERAQAWVRDLIADREARARRAS